MAKKFKGSLTLEWKNKNKSILLLDEDVNPKPTDTPLDTKLHWINEEESLYYELDSEQGKGKKAYWVDRNDIRVKEVRALIHQKTFVAEEVKKKDSLLEQEFTVKEILTRSRGERGVETDGMLIKGDNLLALNALVKHFEDKPEEEKVKCIYIDPPYNTGSAFEHYDDNLEHSEWLTLVRDRLVLLKRVLREDGSIWVNLDDNENHYAKVLLDEIFGRDNFQSNITWQKKYSVSNNFTGIASICDHILVYTKTNLLKYNLLERTEESIARYSNPDNDPRGPWKAVDYLNQVTPEKRPNLCYDIINPNTKEIIKNTSKAWKYDKDTHKKHIEENKLWWGISGNNKVPALKLFLSEVRNGMTPHNWWPHEEVGHTDEAKKESISLYAAKDVFATPKPERLVQRIIHIATNPGDIVLDCFGGSGTTFAVAHKMGRKWVGVEIGNHADTHILPRMKKVLSGEDQSGISKAVNWKGGGSFAYYHLGPSLISLDKNGKPDFNWKLGIAELEKSLLLTYDFTLTEPSSANPASLREKKSSETPTHHTIGYKTKNGKKIAGIVSISKDPTIAKENGEIENPGEFMPYSEFKSILDKVGKVDFISLYTNRGVDVSPDEIPENLEIIKVPSSIFQELED
jgi:adenine-specific DNA-methyltransferase